MDFSLIHRVSPALPISIPPLLPPKAAPTSFGSASSTRRHSHNVAYATARSDLLSLTRLGLLNNAHKLDDLRVPPVNRLEALKGKRKGQHSIRINDQWRICFVWSAPNAHDVEIVGYH